MSGHERCATHPALRDKRDMPMAFVPLCPAHELRNRDTAGHLSRFVPLCPAVSRGLTRHPAHLGQKAQLPHGSTAIS